MPAIARRIVQIALGLRHAAFLLFIRESRRIVADMTTVRHIIFAPASRALPFAGLLLLLTRL
jgi:hypothetical protein